MDINKIFQLQDLAVPLNRQGFARELQWCHHAIELALDSHVFLANDPEILAYRKNLRDSDIKEFKFMNVVVNLAYDSMGTLISALRLLEYGVFGDAWALIRVAFESTCYSEYFTLNKEKVPDFIKIGEGVQNDLSTNVLQMLNKSNLKVSNIIDFLQKHDKENRRTFYARLCNMGVHALPLRVSPRISVTEKEFRAYLSIEHPYLRQCIADLAATAKYTSGIPFEAWPDLMQKEPTLVIRYKALEEEYKHIFQVALQSTSEEVNS